MAHNKKVKKEEQEQLAENAVKTESIESGDKQEFFPNLVYNRHERTKFLTLSILLFVCMGLVIGLCFSMGQWVIGTIFASILLLVFFLIPSTLKTHPVKPGVPEIVVEKRDITIQGKHYDVQDIDTVTVTVLLAPVSKLDSENKAYIKEMATTPPEEPYFGNVDITLKPGAKIKKGDALYVTVDDCIGALIALMGAGVKHYKVGFSLKKLYETATFQIKKEEEKKQSLSDTSEKDRLKQLL